MMMFCRYGAHLVLSIILLSIIALVASIGVYDARSLVQKRIAHAHAPYHTDPSIPAAASDPRFLEFVASLGGSMQTVVIQNNTAYLGQGGALLLLSLDTSPPTRLARLPLTGFVQDIALSANLAYVAVGTGGVHIVDVATPNQPAIIGNIATTGPATAVSAIYPYAYITTTGIQGGLQIVDVSTPASPKLLGQYRNTLSGAATALNVQATRAFIAAGSNRAVQVVDVSNPINPTLLAEINTSAPTIDIAVISNLAYVAADRAGLLVIDISSPSNPAVIGSLELAGKATAVQPAHNIVYVTMDTGHVAVVDVANPSSPQQVGIYEGTGAATDIGIDTARSIACVAASGAGMHILNISTPISPTLQHTVETIYGAQSLHVVNDRAYIAAGDSGVYIFSVQNQLAPALLSNIPLSGTATGVFVADNLAYIAADTEGLYTYDVSDPAKPLLRGHVTLPGRVADVQVITNQGLAYVAAGSTGLHMVDVSNPMSPTLQSSYNTPGSAQAVEVVGTFTYLADQSSVQILDSTSPVSPTLLGSFDMEQHGYAQDIQVVGDRAYVASGGFDGGLKILDVSTPQNPTFLATTTDAATGVSVSDGIACLATVSAGVQCVHIGTADAPANLMQFDTPGIPHAVQVVGEMVYVADFSGGFLTLRFKDAAATIFLPIISRS